jgi:hypothetical protein
MYNGDIAAALSAFNPIGLDGIGSVRFMNRFDTKYVFCVSKLTDLINLLGGKYKVLEIADLRVFPYLTTYLDTPDYLFYNQHVTGKLERHKIRYRKYESTGTSFLEIKLKTNKRRTIKWRIVNQLSTGTFDDRANIFLRKHFLFETEVVKPVLINRFTRATLIGLESKERITLDYNILFSSPDNDEHIEMPYLAIAELKKEGYSRNSAFSNLIKQLNIYPAGFSKYCMGSIFLNDSLKQNMLKPKLLFLNKIENEYISSCSN